MKKNTDITTVSSVAEYLTYIASAGDSFESFEARFDDENIWLTQRMMASLYDVKVNTINEHIKKIYSDGELARESTIRYFRIVHKEGNRNVKRDILHYNLQVMIAVGFKVNSERAVRFRKWAGKVVKDYTIQGWAMDAGRLKQGHKFTEEFFDKQLQQIREIRLSERKFYQKVTDIYATAFDYDKDTKTTQLFFKTVRSKINYAAQRRTEVDIRMEKNYFSKEEMDYLERIVTLYLDYAENQARRHIPMSMEDWAKRLDGFLEFNGDEILIGPGKISAEEAKLYAETEFEKYRIIQDRLFQSDFDRFFELEESIKE